MTEYTMPKDVFDALEVVLKEFGSESRVGCGRLRSERL
jgi:hypothetical protein